MIDTEGFINYFCCIQTGWGLCVLCICIAPSPLCTVSQKLISFVPCCWIAVGGEELAIKKLCLGTTSLIIARTSDLLTRSPREFNKLD